MSADALGALLDPPPSERTALAWGGHERSYADLVEAVEELAARLSELGTPRTNVLVFGPLCPAYVVALLATVRCGAVPVPVDGGLTAERYAWTERVARPSLVVSSDVSTVTQYAGQRGLGELVLDALTGGVVLELSGARPVWSYRDPDAGYLIPTSGSTGDAKAIVGSRTGLYTFLSWFVDEFGPRPDDVCAAVTRVNFDPSLRELLAVLTVGGRVCLPPVDAQLDPGTLARHLADPAVTMAFLVPSLARRIGDVLAAESVRLPSLRLVFFAGEVLPPRVVEQWVKLAPGAEFVNLYGLTEGTLAQLYQRDVRSGVGPVPVGRPRPGVSVTLDEPDGDGRGEVLISSSAPALGLLSEGDAREVEPLPAPLRTGDLGCWTAQGELVISGRLGNVLKVSGRRVSFDRFVSAVESLPGVAQCVVVDRDGPQAFVAAASAGEALPERIRGVARELGLPKVGVHVRPEFPLLRSGKVDRVALASSIVDRSASVTAGDVTKDLLAILGISRADLSFVDAGLASLDMMDFVLAVNRRFGSNLSVRECFQHRDVASLAQSIARPCARAAVATPRAGQGGVDEPVDERADERADEPAVYPLSTRQVAYIATCMADGNANWCNLSREIIVRRIVPLTEVSAAVDGLIARHDALRLALTPDWSGQVHAPTTQSRCAVTTVVIASDDDRARLAEVRAAAVSEPIDPTIAPPLRVVVVHGRDTTSVLLIAHHLFVDGLSMDLLAAESRAALTGQRIDATPRPSYRAYCVTTRRTAQRAHPDAAYWHELLTGADQLVLPEPGGPEGELLSRPFGLTHTRLAHRLAAATGVSVFAVILAAFEASVAKTFGLESVPIVLPIQIRDGMPTSAVGMFMSQLVVRGRGSGSLPDKAREFARQVDLGAAHSGWEFDQRIAALGFAGAACFPLSTVLFNQHPMPRGLRQRDLGQWRPRSLGRALRYQLQGELQMSAAELAMTYYYRRGITAGRPDVIDEVHDHLLAALRTGHAQ